MYLFVLRRLARKCTKIYNACRTIVRLIKPFVLRQLIKTRFAAVVLWKAPIEFVNFGKCRPVRQFAEIQSRIFHRMESAIDFSLHGGACFRNCFSHYHLVILISI